MASDDDKRAENLIKIWDRAVQTQMHFNEMSVKSRQLGFTFVAAALGAAAYTLSKDGEYSFDLGYGFKFHVSLLLTMIGGLAVSAIRQLDLGVYHRMLRGAVTFNEDLEATYLAKYLDLNKGMTEAISHYSRNSDADKRIVNGRTEYIGNDKKSAAEKLQIFYRLVIRLIFIFGLLIAIFTNWKAAGAALSAICKSPTTISAPTAPAEKKN